MHRSENGGSFIGEMTLPSHHWRSWQRPCRNMINTVFSPAILSHPPQNRLNFFERYLTIWVILCMAVGLMLGKVLPGFTAMIRDLEFASGSRINLPIAVLIWLMIYPMMLKVDFGSLLEVRSRPKGILITLFVNWLVKPFS